MSKAVVNKIIDMSVVDGPGNRSSIFFQGCNFDCFYCHNPETIHHCIHCGKCVQGCPTKALSISNQKVIWDESLCINCDQCTDICPHDASPKTTIYSPKELSDRIAINQPFIQGITTSGGECTLQAPFLIEFFQEIKKHDLTCFVDTNGAIDLQQYPQLVELTDGFMLDIKATDPNNHFAITNSKNDQVLKNAQYLAQENKLYELRTVLIDGMNNHKTIEDISKLLPHHKMNYKLINYRDFGVRKQFRKFRAPSKEEVEDLQKLALSYGFEKVTVL